jgi:hypothetical protein
VQIYYFSISKFAGLATIWWHQYRIYRATIWQTAWKHSHPISMLLLPLMMMLTLGSNLPTTCRFPSLVLALAVLIWHIYWPSSDLSTSLKFVIVKSYRDEFDKTWCEDSIHCAHHDWLLFWGFWWWHCFARWEWQTYHSGSRPPCASLTSSLCRTGSRPCPQEPSHSWLQKQSQVRVWLVPLGYLKFFVSKTPS